MAFSDIEEERARDLFYAVLFQMYLWTWYAMVQVSEELEEVEEELEAKESGNSFVSGWKKFVNPVFVQAFTMTALAEWGDRSQVRTPA
jgi:putative Ca2+/H+ antiporter (TMEM165/GDT1 family)